eukprot:6650681-Lingulodinium_polyedra.AAC.1
MHHGNRGQYGGRGLRRNLRNARQNRTWVTEGCRQNGGRARNRQGGAGTRVRPAQPNTAAGPTPGHGGGAHYDSGQCSAQGH